MSSYRELTLEYIESLQDKNKQLVSDLDQLETINKKIDELKEEINNLNDKKKKIDKKYKDSWNKYSLTDEILMLYCENRMFDETNLRIRYINGKSLFLSGSYNYGQHTLYVEIPDYDQFIKDGYHKLTLQYYDSTYTAIIVNRYTPEIMKEIIYMYLKDKLKSLIDHESDLKKWIKGNNEKLEQTKKEIEEYHDVKDSIIRGMYNEIAFSPTNMKEEFMDSLPRKIDVHKLLEEDNMSKDPK